MYIKITPFRIGANDNCKYYFSILTQALNIVTKSYKHTIFWQNFVYYCICMQMIVYIKFMILRRFIRQSIIYIVKGKVLLKALLGISGDACGIIKM